ncbi:putative ribosomal protein [Lachnospiraceae bacterium TWA4]|nr:putative ribosomal protein [Lachnospiraceae bacterium TWA4]
MIEVVLYQNKDNELYGFWTKGHAEYEDYGKDIVCAAVSALSINTVNSIESFTQAKCKTECNDGDLKFCLLTKDSKEAQLLLKSFALGVSQIEEDYGSKYIKISYKNKGR